MKENKERNKRKIEEIIKAEQDGNRFKGNIEHHEVSSRPAFSGVIRDLMDITLLINPNFPVDNLKYPIKEEDAFDATVIVLVGHEITHKEDKNGEGCPKNDNLEKEEILIPVSKVLESKGLPNVHFGNQGHTLYTYFANMFEDVVVNLLNVRRLKDSRGMFLLYNEMGESSPGKFSPLFEAFVKLQAYLSPEKRGLSLVRRHFTFNKDAHKAFKNFIQKTGLSDLEDRVSHLSASKNWKSLSTIFAEEFSKLVDMNNLQLAFFPLIGGNDLARYNNEELQQELAFKYYQRSKQGSKGVYVPPEFIPQNLSLLALYKKLAKNIFMRVKSRSEKVQMPVAYASKKKFEIRTDQIENMAYGLNREGKLEMQVKKDPIMVESGYQVSHSNINEIKVGLIDSSDSTRSPITEEANEGVIINPWAQEEKQWTDNSVYHHELLCFFGLLELFRREGILKRSNTKLISISSGTRCAGDLGEAERLALNPEFGGTTLSIKSIDALFSGRGSLVYTMSDGFIGNWYSKIRAPEKSEDPNRIPLIKDYFIKKARDHTFFHLQFGKESNMSVDLKEAGLIVVYDKGEKTPEFLIDLTQKTINPSRTLTGVI